MDPRPHAPLAPVTDARAHRSQTRLTGLLRVLVGLVLAVAGLAAFGVAPVSAAPVTTADTGSADDGTTATDYTSYVDPFMSTQGDDGQNLPGAQVPHGLAKPNPMTAPSRSHTGYDYSQSQIKGFTLSNLDGVGGSGAGGDLLVVPTYQSYTARPDTSSYPATYSHDDETAVPGYYQVGLQRDEGTIDAELTATVRSGLERFTFPEAGTASLVVDLANNFTSRVDSELEVSTLDDGRAELSGYVIGAFNGNTYKLYFDAVTNVAVAGVKTWGSAGTLTSARHRSGTDTGAVVSFDVEANEAVQLTTTLSPISVAQARKDQAAELDGKSFDDVRQAAHQDWQDTLAKVAVSANATSDPDGSLEGIFYTSLYRMLATPVNATSTDGTYRGVDGKVHQADGYIHYDGWGTWDDFRKYAILAYLYPDYYDDEVQSLVDLFADDADAGDATLSSLVQAVPTVRFERAAIVIADALAKGVHLDRLDEAYSAIVANEDTYSDANEKLGYIASDPGTTVGTSYDDYAVSVIADSLGKTDDAATYLARAANYQNVIKPGAWTADDGTSVGVLSAKDASGNWASDDLEQFQAANLYQGTLWQFNWYPVQDMAGLITAMGGTTAVQDALSHYFGEEDPDDGTKMLKSNANEVDLQTPYLFNYVGEPSKTQKWVRDLYTKQTWQNYIATTQTDGNDPTSANGKLTPPIKEKVFKLSPDGFLPTMDDDTGAMSSTFVAAAVGLYPVTAGSSQYQVGSPFFDRVDISHADGTTFSVSADGVSSDDYYIQSATLNGETYGNTWVDYSDLAGNGSFDTVMGDTASDWGTDSAAAFSMSTATDTAPTVTASSDTTTLQADADGGVDGDITMTLSGATLTGSDGDDLVGAGLATVVGLPSGVEASVTRTGDTTLDIHVSGTLPQLARTKFAVRFQDGALADDVSPDAVTGTGTTLRDPYVIAVTSHWRSVLQTDYDQARLVVRGNYEGSTYDALVTARDSAKTLLADDTATDQAVKDADSDLTAALDGLTLSAGGFRQLQAESSDDWSGGELENETSNLGGVRPNSWIAFDALTFTDDEAPDQIEVRYSGASDDGYDNAAVEVHLDATDGPLLATVSTPPTASTFGTYQTVTADLSDVAELADGSSHTVYFVFTGSSTDGASHWVGNFDWMQFVDTDTAVTQPKLQPGNATSLDSGIDASDASLFQNVNDGEWAEYADYDFGSGVDTVSVYYDKPSGRTPTDTSVEIYLDSTDGDPVATVPLTTTGSSWGTYTTTTVAIGQTLTGVHDVYLVFSAPEATTDLPYVANIGYVQFSSTAGDADGLALSAAGYSDWSAGGLKTETSTWDDGTTVTDVGGTYDGAWLEYDQVAFADTATSLSVHYVNNSSRCGTDSSIDVYLDSADGDPVVSVPLPVTGTAWTNAGTTTVTLPDSISGTHDVYVVMHTTADDDHPYVANLDSFTFNYGVDKSGLQDLYDSYSPLLADGDRYVPVDFATFTAQMTAAEDVLVDDDALNSEVTSATRMLRLAAAQLDPAAERELGAAIDDAEAIKLVRYTDETAAALKSELATAQQMYDDGTATDQEYADEADRVEAAIAALVRKPDSAPGAPESVSATASGRSLTVAWAAPEDDGGSAITGYQVTLEGDGDERTVSVGADVTSHTFAGLTRGKEYRASVVAVNALGSSVASDYTAYVPIAATVPTVPDRPAASVVGHTVTVTWAAPDDGGSALTGYLVRLTPSADPVTVPAGTTSYRFTGLAAGDYAPQVAASNALGSSPYSAASNQVTVDADRVTGATAKAPSWSRVTVSWTTSTGSASQVLKVSLTRAGRTVDTVQVWSDKGRVVFTGLAGSTTYRASVAVVGQSSAATATVRTPARPSVHSAAVSISGKPRVGHRLGLHLHRSGWSAGVRFTYLWKVAGRKVGSGAHLRLRSAYRGKKVVAVVTGHKGQWRTATVRTKAVRVRR
ncbi:MAG: glycoside hydrolase family 92 protein [Nocardioides sp.]|uniref:glycoside hydrolase domain-containing protein n=1 Tax=Nocardioides sp. TaxID=35761 RepID=UPI0039E720F9